MDTNFSFACQTVGNVNSIAIQSDGKILLGGAFGFSGGPARTNISRLNADGTIDVTFKPAIGGQVEALALQPDGKILVGGIFTNTGGVSCTNLGRLNADGSVDLGFNASAASTAWGQNSYIYSLALQTDGKIVVGGWFDTLGGQQCFNIVRLNGDGSSDFSFNALPNQTVFSLALQPDGGVLVGGSFYTFNGVTRSYMARFLNDEPATQSLQFTNSTITWLRGGSSPELWHASFDASANGNSWTSLGSATRIAGGWQLTGVQLGTNNIIRANGWASGGECNGSGSLLQSFLGQPTTNRPVLSLNFSNGSPVLGIIGDSGRPYAVEYASSASSNAPWETLAYILITNSTQTFADSPAYGATNRFYRVRLNQ